jgi:hypothetical protein
MMSDIKVDMIALDCKYVSAAQQGDTFQVLFEKEPPDPESGDEYILENAVPYFLIQRCFEPPDDGRCYVETEDPETCGHCRIGASSLSRDCFQIDLLWTKKVTRRFRIGFKADQETFGEVRRIMLVMLGKGKVHLIGSDEGARTMDHHAVAEPVGEATTRIDATPTDNPTG